MGLRPASTSFRSGGLKDVDSRQKAGHDELASGRASFWKNNGL